MSNGSTLRRDFSSMGACVVLIVVGLAAIYAANDFSMLGSVFPKVISGLMIFLAGLYLVLAWLKPTPARTHEAGSGLRRLGVMVTMIVWSLLLEPIGFLPASVIAFAALLLVANFDRWTVRIVLIYAASGIVVLGALYSIFKFALQVPLPQGWLF